MFDVRPVNAPFQFVASRVALLIPLAQHEGVEDEDETISLAILGRQNVGKSTLLNRMVKENRVITGSYAGLTRDAISVDYGGGESRR